MNRYLLSALVSLALGAPAALADDQSAFFGGVDGEGSDQTGSSVIGSQISPSGSGLASRTAIGALPMTTMDSMVYSAAGNADAIYDDEGRDGPPPDEEFTKEHRINIGIHGDSEIGLTTGHSSILPSAWGTDEFIGVSEFSMSGSGCNNGWHSTGGTGNGNNTGGHGTSTPGVTMNLSGCTGGTNVTINGTVGTELGTGTATADF